MATLTINGRKVTVDDRFRDLSPEQQNATVEEIARSMPEQPSTAVDMLKSGASGLARGAMDLAGLPGTIGDALDAGGEWLMEKAGLPTRSQKMQELGLDPGNPLSGSKIRQAASGATGGATEYQPQTTAGDYTSTVAEFIPGAATMGLNPGNLLRFGVLPGLASEGAGQATEGTELEPYARIAAALVAPAVPSMAARAITPFKIDPARKAAAAVLAKEGVKPTAGQITGKKGLQYAESEIGGSRVAQLLDDQAEAFTDAALRRAGGGGRATSDNMAAIHDRLSKGFDDISARNTLTADPQLVTDMNRVMAEYGRVLPSEQKQIVNNIAQDIVDRFKAGKGAISGADYQSIRSRLSKRAQNARGTDNEMADTWRGLRDALDAAMDRSIAPGDAGEWANLRRQWGNKKVLERAAVGGGEDAAMGLISPARLRVAAAMGKNRGGYARGEGDFAELAKAGQTLLTPLPNSGTASRVNARNIGAGVLAGGGALTAGLPGMVAGMVAPTVAGRALMSRPVQSYLANELLSAPRVADPRYAAIVAALLGRTADPSTMPAQQ